MPLVFLLVGAFLAACAPAATRPAVAPQPRSHASAPTTVPPPTLAASGRPARILAPPGEARARFGDLVDLGWMTLKLRAVEPCDEDAAKLDAVIDVVYRTRPPFREPEFAGVLLDDDRHAIGKTSTLDFGCASDDVDPAAAGVEGAATKRLYFLSGLGASWLSIPLEEPHGFAESRVELALRPGIGTDAAPASPRRPAPPAPRIGDPVETQFYRITPLRLVDCGYTTNANDLWAAEIFVENFSNVALSFPASASLVDEHGRKYEQAYGERATCAPTLDGEVAPGASARGFIRPVEVARGVERVDLLYAVNSRTMWSASEVHTLHLGALPLAALRGRWEPPASRVASGPGYRVTVTSVRRCTPGDGGKDYVGVEVLVENTSASDELGGNPSGELEDASSYRHDGELDGQLTECAPSVGNPFQLKPGQKVRGWLELFHVAVDSGPWTLHYELSGGGRTTIDLPVGRLDATKSP